MASTAPQPSSNGSAAEDDLGLVWSRRGDSQNKSDYCREERGWRGKSVGSSQLIVGSVKFGRSKLLSEIIRETEIIVF